MSVTVEATQSFARVGYDVVSEMGLFGGGLAGVLGQEINFVPSGAATDDRPTTYIPNEFALMTHVGELAPEDQEPVTPFIAPPGEVTKERLPRLSDKTFEGLRPSELGFAAMASLTAWGEAATHGLGVLPKQRAERLAKATEALRALSSQTLHLARPESAELLAAKNARVVLRALKREAAHARKAGDGPRAFTARTAAIWIASRTEL